MQIDARLNVRAGTFGAAVLATVGVVHTYWALGGVWPAADSRSIMRAILNIDKPIESAVVAPLAGLLLLGAATSLARVGRVGPLGRAIPSRLTQLSVIAIASAPWTTRRHLRRRAWITAPNQIERPSRWPPRDRRAALTLQLRPHPRPSDWCAPPGRATRSR